MIMSKTVIEKYKKIPIPVKAAMWFTVCSFIHKAISLLTTPIFTRILTKTEYGQISLYNSWFEIIGILSSLKIYESVFTRDLVNNPEHQKETVSSYQVISNIFIFFGFIIFLTFNRFITSITDLGFILLTLMFVQILFDSAFRLWVAYQKVQYKYSELVKVTIVIALLNPILSLLFIRFFEDKVLARILGIVISNIVVYAILMVKNMFYIQTKDIFPVCKHALTFNLPLIPHYLSQILLNQSDRIMIGRMVNDDAVALYSLAYTIGMLATMLTTSINGAYVPWLYKTIKNNDFSKIKSVNKLLFIGIFGVISIIALIAPELVLILGGKDYLESIPVLYPVAASVYFLFLYTVYANIELYYGKRKYVSLGTIVAAIVNVILNYFGILYWGYMVAAFTTLICYILYSISHIFISRRLLAKHTGEIHDIGIDKALCLGILLIVMCLISYFIAPFIIIRYVLILTILCIALIYLKKIRM